MSIQQDILALTKLLIPLQTISKNSEANTTALQFIQTYLANTELYFTHHTDNNFPSLIISLQPLQKQSDLILHGHIDVIPTEKPEEFIPQEKADKLYGRGSLDMKGALAAMIVLMRELSKQQTKKNIALFITSDEELGGKNGTAYLLRNEGYRSKFFITGEGSSSSTMRIHTKAKGTLLFTIKVKGTSAHGARVWQGENAIEKLFAVYHDITTLFPTNSDTDHWYTTANLSMIKGGEAINKVPFYAEGVVDIRFTEQWNTSDQIITDIIQMVQKKYTGVTVEILFKDTMLYTPEENNILQQLYTVAQKHLPPTQSLLSKTHGTGDARFATEVGIPAVEFGPHGGNNHHHEEYIETASLGTFYAILQDFIAIL